MTDHNPPPVGTIGDFSPMIQAARDGEFVVLRFQDPAEPESEPQDMLARAELDWQKKPEWRFVTTHDVLIKANEHGWSWARPDAAAIAWATDVARLEALDAAREEDRTYGLTKARNKLPWQIALAAAGQERMAAEKAA